MLSKVNKLSLIKIDQNANGVVKVTMSYFFFKQSMVISHRYPCFTRKASSVSFSLRKLFKFKVDSTLMTMFYCSFIESVMMIPFLLFAGSNHLR